MVKPALPQGALPKEDTTVAKKAKKAVKKAVKKGKKK